TGALPIYQPHEPRLPPARGQGATKGRARRRGQRGRRLLRRARGARRPTPASLWRAAPRPAAARARRGTTGRAHPPRTTWKPGALKEPLTVPGSGARGRSRGGARRDGPERGGEGVELGRERFLVAGARAREDVARTPQLGGEGGRAVHGDPRGHRVAPGHRELGHAVGEHAAARVRERAEGGAERVGAQLPLGGGGGALERVRRLTQVLAVAHELQLAERRRARRRDAARHDVGA